MRKNYIFSTVLITLSIVFFISCSKKDENIEIPTGFNDPIASFSYTGNDGPSPVTIVFTNASETIIADSAEYLWTFGEDGPTSTDKNPIHTFYNNTSNPKTKLITLQVTDQVSGRFQRRSQSLIILPSE